MSCISEQNLNIEIAIDDVSYETMRRILRFMYTKQLLDLGEQNTKEIIVAASRYQIYSIMPICEDYLKKYVTFDNVFEMLDLAQACNLKKVT